VLLVVACLASLIVIAMLVARGAGYRGLYVALALATLCSGGLVMSLPGGVGRDAPPAIEIRGSETVEGFAPSIGIWLFVTGVGFVLAACLFRESAPKD